MKPLPAKTKPKRERVAAIIPARNEEKTIGKVLLALIESKVFDEIIVIDDASQDKTGVISKNLGVKVLRCDERIGKGAAMKRGINATSAEIVAFFDADLVGLCKRHIFAILNPVINNEATMYVGVRGHWNKSPQVIAALDPLMAIGGERALRRFVFEKIPAKFIENFAVEIALNHYCLVNKLPVSQVALNNIKAVPKEKKWGLIRGFFERVAEIFEILKIRAIAIINNKDFKDNV